MLDLAGLGLRTGPTLNGIAALGPAKWRALRRQLSRALSDARQAKRLKKFLLPIKRAELFVPVAIGDYSDFFTGIHHATNMGRMLRPDNPLLPNYKWLPIGYHGRSSSIVISGTRIRRPSGQTRGSEQAPPAFGRSRRLDYEAELGFVAGPGNALGKPIPIARALNHVFGVVLLNDWSARDIQGWEYQPLGPFLAKSFASTVSPWVVTLDALAPYRCPAYARPVDDPKPLPYLWDENDQAQGGFDIEVEIQLRTARMKSATRLSRGSFRDSYWTLAQMVTHQTSNGCNLRPGDLLGSGTISGAAADSVGSMMELTQAGRNPLSLPGGETRAFLEDGDEVVLKGRCQGDVQIGFGEAAGTVVS